MYLYIQYVQVYPGFSTLEVKYIALLMRLIPTPPSPLFFSFEYVCTPGLTKLPSEGMGNATETKIRATRSCP